MQNDIQKNQLTNSKLAGIQFPSVQGRAELQTILSEYFDCHSAAETKENLADLITAWTYETPRLLQSHLDISNMVYFVSNIAIMVRKVSTFKCLPGHVTELMDVLQPGYVEGLLNELLQAWICPDDYTNRSIDRIIDAKTAFQLLGKLVTKLECIIEVEEGVSC